MTTERQNEIWAMMPQSERKEIVAAYRRNSKAANVNYAKGYMLACEDIFGTHNLTAQAEEKPKEPRFNIGEKVRINCYSNGEVWDAVMHNKIVTIQDCYVKDGVNMYVLKEGCRDFGEHCLEPYTEPKEEEIGANSPSADHIPDTTKMVDYAQYRLDLAKEFAVAMINNTGNTRYDNILPYAAVKITNEIVKRLKETEE